QRVLSRVFVQTAHKNTSRPLPVKSNDTVQHCQSCNRPFETQLVSVPYDEFTYPGFLILQLQKHIHRKIFAFVTQLCLRKSTNTT
ncbi:MAG: hypothetical protein K2O06_03130, partial [Acetatifactor sp.]|nr:hypothetical protein [Acetatifactor sp.]